MKPTDANRDMFGVPKRLKLWTFLVALFAFAQLQAELYLTSFGRPGMSEEAWTWNLAAIAYDVRHLPDLLLLFLLVITIVLSAAWVFLLFSGAPRAARRVLGRLFTLMLIVVGVHLTAYGPARELRRVGLERAAKRMVPLVDAIRRFEAEMGRPPHELAELTPRYLATVHEFGVRGCRSLSYSVADPPAVWRWQLGFYCPNGMLTLDWFFFRPTGDYPASDNVERIGEWAYFWD